MDTIVTPEDIEAAATRLTGRLRRTPVIEWDGAWLKLELLQHTGSFKPRGAFNRVLTEAHLPATGLVTASGGNHGAAVAFVGAATGLATQVFIPSASPIIKREAVTRWGANLQIVDGLYDDARAAAERYQADSGALMVHAFDHPATVAGQGSVGREFEEQVGPFDTLLVACGGGGLIAGQLAWFTDRVRVVSVEPGLSCCLHAARQAGGPVDVPVGGVAADSLGSKRLGGVAWPLVRRYLAEAVLVGDDDIRAAQRVLWRDCRVVAEPGGATALAALISGAYRPERGERVAVIVCGANCDPADLSG